MWVTVHKRKDRPGWWVSINYKGQRKKKAFGQDKDEAKAYAAKLTAKFALSKVTGEPVVLSQPDQGMPTVREHLKNWLEVYPKLKRLRESTVESYKQCLEDHIYPAIGDRKLDQIVRTTVKRLIADLHDKGLKRQTIHNILTPVKKAFQEAVDDSILKANPFSRTGELTRSGEDRRVHIQPLTESEVVTVLGIARALCPSVYPLLLCAVRTGMRQGELIGLEWGDIDFRGRFIDVRRAMVWGKKSATKNGKIRRVDVSDELHRVLAKLKEDRVLEALEKEKTLAAQVFLAPGGEPWDESNLRRTWRRCLDRAGMRKVRFHDLRHTYASLLGAAGAPPKYVQTQLGHSSIQVTMDIYSHLFPEGNRDWVNKLDSGGTPKENAPHLHPEASLS